MSNNSSILAIGIAAIVMVAALGGAIAFMNADSDTNDSTHNNYTHRSVSDRSSSYTAKTTEVKETVHKEAFPAEAEREIAADIDYDGETGEVCETVAATTASTETLESILSEYEIEYREDGTSVTLAEVLAGKEIVLNDGSPLSVGDNDFDGLKTILKDYGTFLFGENEKYAYNAIKGWTYHLLAIPFDEFKMQPFAENVDQLYSFDAYDLKYAIDVVFTWGNDPAETSIIDMMYGQLFRFDDDSVTMILEAGDLADVLVANGIYVDEDNNVYVDGKALSIGEMSGEEFNGYLIFFEKA